MVPLGGVGTVKSPPLTIVSFQNLSSHVFVVEPPPVLCSSAKVRAWSPALRPSLILSCPASFRQSNSSAGMSASGPPNSASHSIASHITIFFSALAGLSRSVVPTGVGGGPGSCPRSKAPQKLHASTASDARRDMTSRLSRPEPRNRCRVSAAPAPDADRRELNDPQRSAAQAEEVTVRRRGRRRPEGGRDRRLSRSPDRLQGLGRCIRRGASARESRRFRRPLATTLPLGAARSRVGPGLVSVAAFPVLGRTGWRSTR